MQQVRAGLASEGIQEKLDRRSLTGCRHGSTVSCRSRLLIEVECSGFAYVRELCSMFTHAPCKLLHTVTKAACGFRLQLGQTSTCECLKAPVNIV